MRRSCWHDWHLGLGVLLTLSALAVFAPRASAGCSEPTIVLSSPAGNSHQAEVGLLASTLMHSLPHLPRPCSGPNCSRVPQVPQAPPTTTIAPIQLWACLALISADALFQINAYPLKDDPHTPIFRKSRIYHPPR